MMMIIMIIDIIIMIDTVNTYLHKCEIYLVYFLQSTVHRECIEGSTYCTSA